MRVSVVIPTYNRVADLKRAIDSVLAQTYPIEEIIVVDDGSTDNTQQIVAALPGPVQYVYQKNAGPAAARNRGINMASGEWVAFLDSDDWWLPEKIRLQVEAAERDLRVALVYTSACIVSPDGTREIVQAADPAKLWPTLRHSNLVFAGGSCVMARRDAIMAEGCFPESLMVGEDWGLWASLARKHPFAAVPEPVTAICVSQNSISHDPERTVTDMELILEGTLLAGLEGPARWIWRRRIRALLLFRAAMNARILDRAYERRLLFRSLMQWPSPTFFFRRWKALAACMLRPASKTNSSVAPASVAERP